MRYSPLLSISNLIIEIKLGLDWWRIARSRIWRMVCSTATLYKLNCVEQNWICIHIVWAINDDFIKWKHFPRYWPFVWGIHRGPHKGQWRGALMFSLICVWIHGWVNNRKAGDLRRYCAHYDVTVGWGEYTCQVRFKKRTRYWHVLRPLL